MQERIPERSNFLCLGIKSENTIVVGAYPITVILIFFDYIDWVWKPGKDDSQPPDWEGNWETRKWIRDSQPPDWGGDWKIRKWIGVSQSPDLAWWNSFYDSVREYDYKG